jgi:hypothetical protein
VNWSHREISVSQQHGEITIVRYPSTHFWTLDNIWLIIWLLGWAAAEYHVGWLLWLGLPYKGTSNVRHDPFTWLWFIFWTFFGIAALAVIYALAFSRPEAVVLKSSEIVVAYSFGHWHRSKRFRIAHIRGLQCRRAGRRGSKHQIEFEYEGKMTSLLPASDRESTQRMLDEISSTLANRS